MKNRRLLAVVGVLSLTLAPALLSGCNPEPAPPSGPGAGPGAPGAPGAPAGALTADSTGAEIWAAKCQGCHGADGHGGSGPSLVGEAHHSVEELAKVISEGEGDGKMPAFKGQLTDNQITKVAGHVKTIK